METQKLINDIFIYAKNEGLKDVSIRIYEDSKCVLYVGEKNRFGCKSLAELLGALQNHKEDLSWMNE